MKIGLKDNNKGAAFVTVLIAIFFISLISTSLLYMATMNYLSKSMRYSSTDNYYTAEFALSDLGTTIQNIAAQQTTVNKAKIEVDKAIGASGYTWNRTNVESLIQSASREATISVNYAPKYDTNGDGVVDVNNLTYTKNGVTLLGVEVTSITDAGYQTTVCSDITIVYETDMGKIDVNDFSILTDSPVKFNMNSAVWAGYVFIGKGPSNASTVLTLENGAILTISGRRAIINGDVEVGTGTTLNIFGEVTVYGRIHVAKGATFMCTGTLHHTGNIVKDSGATIKGIPSSEFAGDPTIPKMDIDSDGDGNPDDYLAAAILCNIKLRCSNGGCTTWHEVSLDDVINHGGGQLNGENGDIQLGNSFTSSDGTNVNVNTHVGLPNSFEPASNELILDVGDVKLNDSTEYRGCHTTFVGTRSITFGETDNNVAYITHLSDEMYEACKDTLFGGNGTVQGYNIVCASGNTSSSDYIAAMSETGNNKCELTAPNPANGTSGRYVYFHNNKNYVPVGYFIREDASSIISMAFAASQGDLSPENNYAMYTNYMKY